MQRGSAEMIEEEDCGLTFSDGEPTLPLLLVG
jgi:hypothetical protein